LIKSSRSRSWMSVSGRTDCWRTKEKIAKISRRSRRLNLSTSRWRRSQREKVKCCRRSMINSWRIILSPLRMM
jgi:hypothetical protein